MARQLLPFLALSISTAFSAAVLEPRQNASAWKDPSLSASQRADSLLVHLSWEEKIGQMGGIRQLLGVNDTFNRTTWNTLYPLQHGILSE